MNSERKPEFGDPCTRCGICCIAEPCAIALELGADPNKPCNFLRWTDTGQSSCEAVNLVPELGTFLGIGEGCDSGPVFGPDDEVGMTAADYIKETIRHRG